MAFLLPEMTLASAGGGTPALESPGGMGVTLWSGVADYGIAFAAFLQGTLAQTAELACTSCTASGPITQPKGSQSIGFKWKKLRSKRMRNTLEEKNLLQRNTPRKIAKSNFGGPSWKPNDSRNPLGSQGPSSLQRYHKPSHKAWPGRLPHVQDLEYSTSDQMQLATQHKAPGLRL